MNVKNKALDVFPALGHRNFRLFWSGQVVSLVGTWMQNAALSWVVYMITNNRFEVGVMSAVQFTPVLLFSLYAGIIIEKYAKRRIIIFTQAFQAVAAFILFLLVFLKVLSFPYILVIMFCIGTVQAIDNPARQSFVVEMVEGREHLINAIALNSAAFNGARLIGPTIAGIVLADLGATWCFLFNAVSFIAVIIGLLMMSMEDRPTRTEVKTLKEDLRDIKEGIIFIVQTPKLFYTFLSVAIIPTFCMNFNILLPIFTRDVLKLQSKSYGILVSSIGLGALIGALTVAAKSKKDRSISYQLLGSFGLSVSLILSGFTANFYLSFISLAICGFFMITYNTTCNSILQLNAPDHMRGRVMSVYSLLFGGLAPVGALYAGGVAALLGAENAFRISGLIGIVGFLLLYSKRKVLR